MVKWSNFLKDVLICSLGACGGPEAHYSVFIDQMVVKKNYLTEEELVELIALTGILPGPSSTQTIVSIGYKVGGPLLALLTMLVWALPVIIIMILLSFFYSITEKFKVEKDVLRFISPMAVGFVIVSAYRIGRKVVKDKLTFYLYIFAVILTYFIRKPWIFPLVLIMGGVISITSYKEKELWNKVILNPPWKYFYSFVFFIGASIFLKFISENKLIGIFESFYRYGYLVIGGGQVVIPLMYGELVEINQFMNTSEFLTGFGLVQGLPGPMFSFSAYAGALIARGQSSLIQTLGGLIASIGIFLPGLLLIYFVYPIWENLKQIKGIKLSLKGLVAVAGGLVFTTGIILMQKSEFSLINIIIITITTIALFSKKIPAPIIVLVLIVFGIIF